VPIKTPLTTVLLSTTFELTSIFSASPTTDTPFTVTENSEKEVTDVITGCLARGFCRIFDWMVSLHDGALMDAGILRSAEQGKNVPMSNTKCRSAGRLSGKTWLSV
jgi:uncharacterized protein YcsI (UPF0317 family)